MPTQYTGRMIIDREDAKEGLRDAKKDKFVEAFAKTGVIQPACDAAGIGRTTYKRWCKDDEDFAGACQEAYQCAVDEAEVELRARGVHGTEEPVLYKGEPIWRRDATTGELQLDDDFNPIPFTIKRKSDRLLEVYTRTHRPQYKEKSEITLTGPGGGPVQSAVTVKYVLPDNKTKEDYEDVTPFIEGEHQLAIETEKDPLDY